MFGMGISEIAVILVVALIFIGPKKLPEMAKTVGRALNEFRRATTELKDAVSLESEVNSVKSAFDNMNTTAPSPEPAAEAPRSETGSVEQALNDWKQGADKKADSAGNGQDKPEAGSKGGTHAG